MRVVVSRVQDFADGERRIIDVDGKSVGVFRIGDSFFALRNRCPHQYGPLCIGAIASRPIVGKPGEFGMQTDAVPLLACPWHGWEYDLATGQSFMGPGHVDARRYDIVIESGSEIVGGSAEMPSARADALVPGPYVAETVQVFVEDDYVVIED